MIPVKMNENKINNTEKELQCEVEHWNTYCKNDGVTMMELCFSFSSN